MSGLRVVWVHGATLRAVASNGEATDTLFGSPEGLDYAKRMVPLLVLADDAVEAATAALDFVRAHCWDCRPPDSQGEKVRALTNTIWAATALALRPTDQPTDTDPGDEGA